MMNSKAKELFNIFFHLEKPDITVGNAADDNDDEESEAHEEKRVQALDGIIDLITRQEYTFPSALKDLGEYITSLDARLRVRSLVLICEVIKKCPTTLFTPNQLEQLVVFFLARLESDAEKCALACLKGIQLVSQLHEGKISFQAQAHAANEVLIKIPVQELAQPLRNSVFLIASTFVLRCFKEKKFEFAESKEYASNFRVAMDGEKDPRCLVVCLGVVANLLKFPKGDLFVKDAYEVTNVYFPVTFYPPPNDPHKITHEILVDALNSVFCGHLNMCHYIVPMAMERMKLTSTEASVARIESLKTLTSCIPYYGAPFLFPYLEELRDVLVGLILSPDEAELAEESLNCLKAIVLTLSPYEHTEAWEVFVLVSLRRCGQALELSIDSMASRGAMAIFVAVSQACGVGLKTGLSYTLPIVKKWLLVENVTMAQKISSVSLLRDVICAFNCEVDYTLDGSPMEMFALDICNTLIKELDVVLELNSKATLATVNEEDEEFCVLVLSSIQSLFIRPKKLTAVGDVEIVRIIKTTNEVLQLQLGGESGEFKSNKITGVCICVLKEMDEKYSRALHSKSLLMDFVLPALFSLLVTAKKSLACCLLSNLILKTNEEVNVLIADVLLEGFLHEFSTPNPSALAITTLKVVIENSSVLVVKQCFFKHLLGKLLEESGNKANVILLGSIARKVQSDANISRELLNRSMELLIGKGVFNEASFVVFLYCCKMDGITVGEVKTIVGHLPARVVQEKDDFVLLRARFISSLINKVGKEEALDAFVGELIQSHSGTANFESLLYLKYFFIALCVRDHPKAAEVGKILVEYILNEQNPNRDEIATVFGEAIDQHKNKEAYPRQNIMYRQKLFEQYINVFSASLVTNANNKSVWVALSRMVSSQGLPEKLVAAKILQISIMTIRMICIENRSKAMDGYALKTLGILITKSFVHTVLNNLDVIVPFLLAQATKAAGEDNRMQALVCLRLLAENVPYHRLHNNRNLVLKGLTVALDDSKKNVRKQAVETREKWAVFHSDV